MKRRGLNKEGSHINLHRSWLEGRPFFRSCLETYRVVLRGGGVLYTSLYPVLPDTAHSKLPQSKAQRNLRHFLQEEKPNSVSRIHIRDPGMLVDDVIIDT